MYIVLSDFRFGTLLKQYSPGVLYFNKKVLDIMFSDSNFDVNEHLKEKGAAIGGNITVRFYPKGGKGVLGSHVDGVPTPFMTFLFSNGQGLEILKR